MTVCHVYILRYSNGKQYVGVSKDPLVRMNHHLRGRSLPGYAARKHGIPTLKVVLTGERAYCMRVEGLLTDTLNTVVPYGYNLQRGGTGGSVPSKLTRQRMSAAQKDRFASKEARAKLREAQKGRIASEETRRRMSKSAKKHSIPWHAIKAANAAVKGTKHSLKRRQAASERAKLWWINHRRAGV